MVDRIRPPATGRRELWDDVVPGLGLRVSETGAKSWFWLGRIRGRGKLIRYGLGPYPAVKLKQARAEAREALHAALRGEDPRAARREARRAQALSFEKISKQFVDRYVRGEADLRTADEVDRKLELHVLPRWRGRLIGEITRRDVIELLDELVDDGMGAGANRVFAVVRKLFNWACSRDLIPASPCAGVSPPAPETRKDRVLSDDEIRALWIGTTAKDVAPVFGRLVRMMLTTGQRRGEVSRMRWDDVDEDRAEWTIPAEHYKSARIHVVPLSDLALEIFEDCPEIEKSPWVFTGARKAPVSGFSKHKVDLDAAAPKVGSWTLHDLRRTAASKMTEAGIPRFVVERVLGHADRAVTAIYDRHSYAAEKREALETWSRVLRKVVTAKGRAHG